MKLLHTADFHFGKKTHGSYGEGSVNSRLRDIERAVGRVYDTAKAKNVDGIIIAGDVFEHSTPTPTQQRVAIESVKKLVSVAPVFMTTGNHDHPVTKGLNHANDVFNEVGQVTLIDRPQLAKWQGINIAVLPWPVPDFVDGFDISILEEYQAIVNQAADADGPSIAVGHLTCKGSLPSGSERSLEMSSQALFPIDLFAKLDYTALGHIHKHQEVGPNVVYSGAPERFTFGEMEPKGSVIVDLQEGSTSWTFAEHKASAFTTIDVEAEDDESPTSVIIEAIKNADVTDAFVRISYTGAYTAQLTPIQAALTDAGARKLTELKQITDQQIRNVEEVNFDDISERELVEAYFEERGIAESLQKRSLGLYDKLQQPA